MENSVFKRMIEGSQTTFIAEVANEEFNGKRVTPTAYSTLVISQIKSGGTDYYVKDAEARTNLDKAISAIEALGTAADKNYTTTMDGTDTYLPTSKAVKTYVDAEVAKVPKFDVVICAAEAAKIPAGAIYKDGTTTITGTMAASASTMYKIYMIKNTDAGAGAYLEYITIKNGDTYSWEQIGSTVTDLSQYAKKGTYTGTASVTYKKANAATDNGGAATIQGSNFTFTGSTTGLATVTVSDYAKSVSTTAAPTATFTNYTSASLADAPTFTGTAATLSYTFNPDDSHKEFVTGITTTASSSKDTVKDISKAELAAAPEFTGTVATISITTSDFVTGVSGAVGTTATFSNVTTAALAAAPTFNGTAATIDTKVNVSSNQVVTSISTSAASKSSATFATGVSFTTPPSFAGTSATINVSGSLPSHTHSLTIKTKDQEVVTAASHTSASWTSTVNNEVLSFTFVADTFSRNTTSIKVFDGAAPSATGNNSAATVSASGSYTPAGNINNVGLTVSTASISYNTDAIKSASPVYATTTLTSESYTPAGTITKPSITLGSTTITYVKTVSALVPSKEEKTISTSYTPAGTISKPNITLTSSTKTFVTAAIGSVTPQYASITKSTSYTPAGTISKPNVTLGGSTVITYVTSAINSATLVTGSKKIESAYTPAGSISGSQTLASHTHAIGSSDDTANGTATITLS